jgi:SAM-dependent methyltransferase
MPWLARLYIWATHRLYAEFAWAYDLASWLVSLGHWSTWRRAALDHLIGERVLEVGFGTGELLLDMASQGLQVTGLELSPAMHRVTARKLARRGGQILRVRAEVQAMPFAAGRFDSIVSTFPSGYILDPTTLCEAARLLRPADPVKGIEGGRLVVVGMVVWSDHPLWRQAARLAFGAQEEALLNRFERLAKAAGLRVTVIDPRQRGFHVPVVVAEWHGSQPPEPHPAANTESHRQPGVLPGQMP